MNGHEGGNLEVELQYYAERAKRVPSTGKTLARMTHIPPEKHVDFIPITTTSALERPEYLGYNFH